MPKSPEAELEEFLAPLPAYQRKLFELGISSLTQDELWLFMNSDFPERERLKRQYEQIVQYIPKQWKQYRKRALADSQMLPAPKASPGRRPDSTAEEYAALHSSKSYAEIAKKELEAEPEGEAKKLLIQKEAERIRASVRRSRRRNKT